MKRKRNKLRPTAVTLVELLVVVGVILLLFAILAPAIAGARARVRVVDTKSEMRCIAMSCEAYYTTFGTYPGLFSEGDIALSHRPGSPGASRSMSGTQNMLLSLMAAVYPTAVTGTTKIGLFQSTDTAHTAYVNPPPVGFQALGASAIAGSSTGPIDQASGTNYPAFYTPRRGDLATTGGGFMNNQAGGVAFNGGLSNYAPMPATPTAALPTFVDRFPDPLPILYYRKTPGVDGGAYPSQPLVSNCPNPSSSNWSNDANYMGAAAFYAATNDEYTDAGAYSPVYGQALESPSGAIFNENPSCASSWTASGSLGYPNWAYFTAGDSHNSGYCALASFVMNPTTGAPVGGFVLIAAGAGRQYGYPGPVSTTTSDNIVVVGGH